jgi:hypothetical protein
MSAMIAVGVGIDIAAAKPVKLGQALLGYVFFSICH